MKFLLCGLPNSGKSTSGAIAAQMLQWPFIDLDDIIEVLARGKTGKERTCRDIYSDEGSKAFRAYETNALETLNETNTAIIALGGGALETQQNRSAIENLGSLIYLQCDPLIAYQRSAAAIPPYLDHSNPQQSFVDLATRRQVIYKAASQITIDATSHCPATVAHQIVATIRGYTSNGKQ